MATTLAIQRLHWDVGSPCQIGHSYAPMPCPMVGHVFTNRTGWKRRSSEWILCFVCPILSFIYTLGFHDVSCICEISSDEFGVHLQKWSCRLCGMPAHWCRPHTLSPPKPQPREEMIRGRQTWRDSLSIVLPFRYVLPTRLLEGVMWNGCRDVKETHIGFWSRNNQEDFGVLEYIACSLSLKLRWCWRYWEAAGPTAVGNLVATWYSDVAI